MVQAHTQRVIKTPLRQLESTNDITAIFNTPRPIQFTSSLPITTCVERLREGVGKPMGCFSYKIEGYVKQIDGETYGFKLYQNYRGGHTITGRLIAQTDTSTRVDASHTVDRTSWSAGILFAVVMVVMIFAVQIPKGELITGLLLSIIFIAITMGIMFTSLKAQPISQLVWWFERTLKQ